MNTRDQTTEYTINSSWLHFWNDILLRIIKCSNDYIIAA